VKDPRPTAGGPPPCRVLDVTDDGPALVGTAPGVTVVDIEARTGARVRANGRTVARWITCRPKETICL
jgi:hypothetical protein